MKSKFKYYIVVWAVLVALFNVVTFVTPSEIAGMSKFTGSFWLGYIFIMIAFLGQLGVAWYSLKGESLTKVFYRIPLFSISYISLGAMLVAGILCMAIPKFPVWLGTILCVLILVASIIVLLQAQTAGSIVEDIDKKVKVKTFFIKSLIADIDSLTARSESSEISDEIKKVYETARYSDPMSNEALSGIESQITLKMTELSECVEKVDPELVKKAAKEMCILLNDRNNRCKLLK